MICQKYLRPFGRQLNVLQKSSAQHILKANVYNDSLEIPENPPRKKLTPIRKPDKYQYTFTNMFFRSNDTHKKDWLEDFRRIEWTPEGINTWWHFKKYDLEMIGQEFIEDRHKILGSDLAAAIYIIARGGRAKFKDKDEWFDLKNGVDLPKVFDPQYVLIALDCSGIQLFHESLHNLINLSRLKWVSFRGNQRFSDWSLDKITSEFTNLEYLDVSDCEQVTERGLESLYKMHKLKKLIITNHYNSQAMELTCLMLEECLPYLVIDILDPKDAGARCEVDSKGGEEAK